MDNKFILLIFAVIIAIIILTFGLVSYLKCQQVIQINTGNQTPVGLCLLECDKYSDVGYCACDPNDNICIRGCYDEKAKCYMKCLELNKETLKISNCGC